MFGAFTNLHPLLSTSNTVFSVCNKLSIFCARDRCWPLSYLWGVVRVAELGGDVQPEVVRPVKLFVSKPHHLAIALLDDGLGQHRLN